jgi:glycine/D-amino acid oxidase-like deaminating enzyme
MAPPTVLPTPDFTWDPVTNPPKAGLRPKRDASYRLEPETQDDRLIVHNYGHAGAGITMSWGCALEVVDLVLARGVAENEPVAVLGGGVMGLTAAVLLAERNLRVTVYAAKFPPETTSNVAGGQWAPASVEHNNTAQFERILRRSFAMHQAKGAAYGVSARPNYSKMRLTSFEDVPEDVVPAPTPLAHLPFAQLNSRGFEYRTLLVEPPIFLPKLLSDLDAAQVPRVTKTFARMSQVLEELDQKIIVNCTGLGARDLCNDRKVKPVKGQLAMLPAQRNLQYLYSGDGYLFPRQDAVVIGGTEETTFSSDQPNIARCKRLVAHLKSIFAPGMIETLTPAFAAEWLRPSWIMRGK